MLRFGKLYSVLFNIATCKAAVIMSFYPNNYFFKIYSMCTLTDYMHMSHR